MEPWVVQAVGIGAGVLTAISMLPQLIKMIREKKADDISIIMLIVLVLGLALWIAYGIMKKDIPIVATNSFSLLLNLVMIFFRYRYR